MASLTSRGGKAYESGGFALPFGRGPKLTHWVRGASVAKRAKFPNKSNGLRIADSAWLWLLLTFRVQRAQTMAESLKPYGGTDTNVSVSE
jgi:hypothetical protein